MPNLISRLYNFVNDKNNGIPITSSRVDAELNQLVTTANQSVIVAATQPSSPFEGMLWWDSTNHILKEYRNNEFVISGIVHVSITAPASPQSGDIWINTSGTENSFSYRNKANAAWIQIIDANVLLSPPPIGTTTPNSAAFSALKVGTTNQGDIFYDNGTTIIRLPPGTLGQSLITQGPTANPKWSTANFGTVETGKSANTVYTAIADGLIFVSAEGITSGNALVVLADSSNPPTTVRGQYRSQNTDGRGAITVPIKSGINYKVTLGAGSLDAYEFWSL